MAKFRLTFIERRLSDMKKITMLLLIIILSIFMGCNDLSPGFTPSEGEGEGEAEATGERVVLVELFNTEGCAASKVANPIAEQLAEEYGTDKVILVEEAGWGVYSTTETTERFSWYVPGEKHTPFIAINGLNETLGSVGSTGGGGGSAPSPPPTPTTPPAPSVDLLLIPISSTVTQGEQLTIQVEIKDVTDLKGASIDLNFASAYLQYVSAQDGGFIPDVDSVVEDYIDNTTGILSLDIAGLGDTAYATGSGTLMSIIFDTINPGNAQITFGLTDLRDKENQSISHDPGDGCSITIQ